MVFSRTALVGIGALLPVESRDVPRDILGEMSRSAPPRILWDRGIPRILVIHDEQLTFSLCASYKDCSKPRSVHPPARQGEHANKGDKRRKYLLCYERGGALTARGPEPSSYPIPLERSSI